MHDELFILSYQENIAKLGAYNWLNEKELVSKYVHLRKFSAVCTLLASL